MSDTPDTCNAGTALALACPFDPNDAIGETAALIRDAAGGDLAAQRAMRDSFISASGDFDPSMPNALLFGLDMVPYARLCAAHGNAEDARRLAGVLCYTFSASCHAGFGNNAEVLAGEAVAILERLADQGDDSSSLAAVEVVNLYPRAGDIARRLLKGVQ